MSPRALTLALIGSVALNLFVIGVVVGGVVVGHRMREAGPGANRPRQPLWTAADTLPPEHQQAYRRLLRGQNGQTDHQMRQARQARREAWSHLADEPGPAVSKRLADARVLEMTARAGVEDRIVAFAATLPPAERSELAIGLARSGPSQRGGRQGPRPDHDRP